MWLSDKMPRSTYHRKLWGIKGNGRTSPEHKPQPPRRHAQHPRQHLDRVHPRHHSVDLEVGEGLPGEYVTGWELAIATWKRARLPSSIGAYFWALPEGASRTSPEMESA